MSGLGKHVGSAVHSTNGGVLPRGAQPRIPRDLLQGAKEQGKPSLRIAAVAVAPFSCS